MTVPGMGPLQKPAREQRATAHVAKERPFPKGLSVHPPRALQTALGTFYDYHL